MEITLRDGEDPLIWNRHISTPSILNFRDLGNYPNVEGDSTVSAGRLFRSATPEGASEEDRQVWLNEKKIRTWIDFRSREESKENPLQQYYDTQMITRTGELKEISKAQKSDGSKRVRYVVDMDLTGSVKRFFKMHATAFEKFCMLIAAYLLKWLWPAAVMYVIRIFYGRVGLKGLYLTFLEGAKPQLATALKIIAEAKDGSLINCMLGKDRTGTMAALILLALDVPAERVAFDYSLTAKYLPKEFAASHLKRANFDSEELASSHKGTMSQTIAYLVVNYGGVERYLDSIGFDQKWRERLRANYLIPAEK